MKKSQKYDFSLEISSLAVISNKTIFVFPMKEESPVVSRIMEIPPSSERQVHVNLSEELAKMQLLPTG